MSTPKYVSIPQWCDCCPPTTTRNSKATLFQSHNGAIAAVTVAGDSQSRRWFQSHNGAIAARGWLVKEEEDWRFNPTMVRLLLGDRICEFCVVVRFNPTMVRLLPSLSPVAVERVFGFNPTMVRLLPDKKKDSAFAAKVSIPQWCDCCIRTLLGNTHQRIKVSIPQWCDCCSELQEKHRTCYRVSIPQWCDCCFVV